MDGQSPQVCENGDRINEDPACFLHAMDHRVGETPQKLLPIWDCEIFKIGRDPKSNSYALADDDSHTVSRNHCELYVVVYDPSAKHVYVRDRKSLNGTYVNNRLIGVGPEICAGHLLEDGDVIEIRPHWSFLFRQDPSPPQFDLTSLQLAECTLFAEKYEVSRRCLGHGAEAAVYLARDSKSRSQLACKLVNLDKVQRKNASEQLQRKLQEVDILRQLQHPNILAYVDSIISPHTLYAFVELASGGDLMSFINRHEVIKEFDARIIMRQVVRGLAFLHRKGIVHRDLKPENILLAYSPKIAYHRVVLSDFGTCAVPHRSRMTTNVGTMSYQAPEFFTRTELQTAAVDIWALGVVTLLLLASGSDVGIAYLNRGYQEDVGKSLKRAFSRLIPGPTSNGEDFVRSCLRVVPSERMSAIEAECHDWLCLPEKHLEFFRKLDGRMMAEWEFQTQLRPMPLVLPDLKMERYLPRGDDRMPPVKSTAKEVEPSPKASQHAMDSGRSLLRQDATVPRNEGPSRPPPEGDGMFKKPPPLADRMLPLRRSIKTRQPRTEGSRDKAQDQHVHGKARKLGKRKHKPSAGLCIPDFFLLPLSGLDRHLRPQSNSSSQRQVILEELRRRKSKFLDEAPL